MSSGEQRLSGRGDCKKGKRFRQTRVLVAGRLQGERRLEMTRSQKSENTRAEVKLSTRGWRESWRDPQTEQKREAVPFQNLPEPHVWV